jgi:hypothetical protein
MNSPNELDAILSRITLLGTARASLHLGERECRCTFSDEKGHITGEWMVDKNGRQSSREFPGDR